VNTKSIKDVPKLLYEQLKLPAKTKRRKDGAYTTTADKTAIAELAEDYNHPLLTAIVAIRERRDIIERYLTSAIDSDGRIRCSFDITGTRTGRLSSRESIYGSGTNLQNQPEKLRHIYIPDPGKVFVYRDYSQAEARVVAYLANEIALIDLFNDPTRDVHKENAARIFGIPVGEVTDERRYLAKRIIHASNYGMEAKKFVDVVNKDATDSWTRRGTGIRINLAEARRLLEAYFVLYPGIRDVFWKDCERELRATRTLVSPFGRKRQFFGRWEGNPNFLLEAYSYKPQSAVGDLCCKALVRCYHEIPECDVLLNVHDSILVQCRVEDAYAVAEKMGECMAIPMTVGKYTFTLPTDCKVGYNWGNRGKDGSNPQGLVDISKWKADGNN